MNCWEEHDQINLVQMIYIILNKQKLFLKYLFHIKVAEFLSFQIGCVKLLSSTFGFNRIFLDYSKKGIFEHIYFSNI